MSDITASALIENAIANYESPSAWLSLAYAMSGRPGDNNRGFKPLERLICDEVIRLTEGTEIDFLTKAESLEACRLALKIVRKREAEAKPKPLTMEELVRWAETPHAWPEWSTFYTACRDGVARARRYKTPAEWWAAGDKRTVDRLWTAHRVGLGKGRELNAWPEVEARILAEVRR